MFGVRCSVPGWSCAVPGARFIARVRFSGKSPLIPPMIRYSLSLAAALAAALPLASQKPPQPDWNALGEETVRTMSDYLKINTTNPPGNELQGALFLKGILEREGFEVQILDTAELGKGRANLYARQHLERQSRGVSLLPNPGVAGGSPARPESNRRVRGQSRAALSWRNPLL